MRLDLFPSVSVLGVALVGAACGSTTLGAGGVPDNQGGAAATGGGSADASAGSSGRGLDGATSSGGVGAANSGGATSNGGAGGTTTGAGGAPYVPLVDAGLVGEGATLDAAPPADPFCSGVQGSADSVDVWSDARGPFVVVSGASGTAVVHRHNAVWQDLYRDPSGPGIGGRQITGFPSGDIIVASGTSCGTLVIHDGVATCSPGFVPGDVFAVADKLAYALQSDRALVFDGSLWTQYLDPFDSRPVQSTAWALWADTRTVAVALLNGAVHVSNDGAAFAESGFPSVAKQDGPIPERDRYPSVWGFGGNDIWTGVRQGGLYSYDGSVWSLRATILDYCERDRGPVGLWGQDGVLYIHTLHEVLRVRGERLETLTRFPCTATIRGMWGTSLSEVYVVVTDDNLIGTACGSAELFTISADSLVRL